MAPFLASHVSLSEWLQHLKVDVGLLAAFKGLDDDARQILKDFSAPLGLDVSKWKSNRLQYRNGIEYRHPGCAALGELATHEPGSIDIRHF